MSFWPNEKSHLFEPLFIHSLSLHHHCYNQRRCHSTDWTRERRKKKNTKLLQFFFAGIANKLDKTFFMYFPFFFVFFFLPHAVMKHRKNQRKITRNKDKRKWVVCHERWKLCVLLQFCLRECERELHIRRFPAMSTANDNDAMHCIFDHFGLNFSRNISFYFYCDTI